MKHPNATRYKRCSACGISKRPNELYSPAINMQILADPDSCVFCNSYALRRWRDKLWMKR